MQKEMTAAEQEIRAHEDTPARAHGRGRDFAAELKAAEAALKSEQAEVAARPQELETERGQVEQELERTSDERDARRGAVSRDALDALRARRARPRRGLAMAEARDGLCTVCHVRLRPQVFNEVRRNDGIMQCDSCTRILYFVPVARPSPAAAVTARSAPFPPMSFALQNSMIRAYIDGGARGNPGPAGYGVRIEDADGTLIEELHGAARRSPPTTSPSTTACSRRCSGRSTTSTATSTSVRTPSCSSSRCAANTGQESRSPAALRPRAAAGRATRRVTFEHVRRELNKEADRLSNLGMDEAEARCARRATRRAEGKLAQRPIELSKPVLSAVIVPSRFFDDSASRPFRGSRLVRTPDNPDHPPRPLLCARYE